MSRLNTMPLDDLELGDFGCFFWVSFVFISKWTFDPRSKLFLELLMRCLQALDGSRLQFFMEL